MYYKLAIKNVKKSFKNYAIYFLTLAFAVCIFYSFNSLNSQNAIFEMKASQADYAELMNRVIYIVSLFVSVILAELVAYATNFLINRRKKEFGIYMTLGMKRSKMLSIVFFETLIIGCLSLVVGLLLGIAASQGLSIMLEKMFVVEMSKYRFTFSFDAMIKTLQYFAIMYAFSMIINMVKVSKYKLIDLIYGAKKSEEVKIKNIYVSCILFVASIASLSTSYYFIEKCNLDYTDIRFPVSIILGIVGTATFFYSISAIILFVTEKNKNTYLNGLNIFTIRQITSKFNTNFLSMTTICLMLFVTIGTLSTGLGFKNSFDNSVQMKTTFDASMSVYRKDGPLNVSVSDVLKDYGYNLGENEDYITFNLYMVKADVNKFFKEYLSKYAYLLTGDEAIDGVEAIKLSDINKVRKIQGKDPISLKDDEVRVMISTEVFKNEIDKFLSKEDVIKIQDNDYNLYSEIYNENFQTESQGDIVFGLIIPDELAESAEVEAEIVNMNFKGANKEAAKQQIIEIFKTTNNYDVSDRGYYIYDATKDAVIEDHRGLSTVVLFLAMYLGIIFLLASVAVLALQQLSHCNDSVERYEALKRIGAGRIMINRSIFIQVLIFFMLPLSLAVVHSIIGIDVVSRYVSMFGPINIFNTSLMTAVIMLIVYGGYFYATYRGYKSVIEN